MIPTRDSTSETPIGWGPRNLDAIYTNWGYISKSETEVEEEPNRASSTSATEIDHVDPPNEGEAEAKTPDVAEPKKSTDSPPTQHPPHLATKGCAPIQDRDDMPKMEGSIKDSGEVPNGPLISSCDPTGKPIVEEAQCRQAVVITKAERKSARTPTPPTHPTDVSGKGPVIILYTTEKGKSHRRPMVELQRAIGAPPAEERELRARQLIARGIGGLHPQSYNWLVFEVPPTTPIDPSAIALPPPAI